MLHRCEACLLVPIMKPTKMIILSVLCGLYLNTQTKMDVLESEDGHIRVPRWVFISPKITIQAIRWMYSSLSQKSDEEASPNPVT